jgi:hypothetical protein
VTNGSDGYGVAMARLNPGGAAGRAVGAVTGTDWKSKAKNIAASIKAEYEAGKQGDETPAAPIWATPQQQVESLASLFRTKQDDDEAEGAEVAAAVAGDGSGEDLEPDDTADAVAVADAMRGVDWAGVRSATAERTADATKAMKAMADHVDWVKVQPVAAQVSSALIAALATGQLGVGGRLATTVARAMTNQNGLGQHVAAQLDRTPADVPTDLGPTIAAASREVS